MLHNIDGPQPSKRPRHLRSSTSPVGNAAPPLISREAIEQAVIQVFGVGLADLHHTTRRWAKVAQAGQMPCTLIMWRVAFRSPTPVGYSAGTGRRWRTPAVLLRTDATICFSTGRSICSSGRFPRLQRGLRHVHSSALEASRSCPLRRRSSRWRLRVNSPLSTQPKARSLGCAGPRIGMVSP